MVMEAEREILTLEPIAGDPEVGRWLAAMQDARRDTLRELVDIADDELERTSEAAASSIGTLLYHIALVEADWLFVDILGPEGLLWGADGVEDGNLTARVAPSIWLPKWTSELKFRAAYGKAGNQPPYGFKFTALAVGVNDGTSPPRGCCTTSSSTRPSIARRSRCSEPRGALAPRPRCRSTSVPTAPTRCTDRYRCWTWTAERST